MISCICFSLPSRTEQSRCEERDAGEMQIYAEIDYADYQWDYDAISALGLVLSGLRSVVFNHFRLTVIHRVPDSGHDLLPSANTELVEHWKCIDMALSHPDLSNLTNFTIQWRNPPPKQFQAYKALVPEFFQELLPRFSSRVTISVEVHSVQ